MTMNEWRNWQKRRRMSRIWSECFNAPNDNTLSSIITSSFSSFHSSLEDLKNGFCLFFCLHTPSTAVRIRRKKGERRDANTAAAAAAVTNLGSSMRAHQDTPEIYLHYTSSKEYTICFLAHDAARAMCPSCRLSRFRSPHCYSKSLWDDPRSTQHHRQFWRRMSCLENESQNAWERMQS